MEGKVYDLRQSDMEGEFYDLRQSDMEGEFYDLRSSDMEGKVYDLRQSDMEGEFYDLRQSDMEVHLILQILDVHIDPLIYMFFLFTFLSENSLEYVFGRSWIIIKASVFYPDFFGLFVCFTYLPLSFFLSF